ncbi:MAG: hypothetical protein ACLQSR_01395 [Limisphaerales bacterium]
MSTSGIPAPGVRSTPRGPILSFDGKWKPEYFDLVKKYRACGVYARFFLNQYETDFSFLAEIPNLRYLGIGIAFPFDPTPLYHLRDLRFLWLMSTRTMAIDFTRFKHLEVAAFPWTTGMNSIFNCSTLRRLSLEDYHNKTSDAFRRLTALEALDIGGSTMLEIDAVADLPILKKLRLSHLTRLTSLAPLQMCESLRVLHLGRCGKVTDFSPIRYLQQLQYLILSSGKRISSLEMVKSLNSLRLFNFDLEVEDGNMEILKELPRLAHTVFPKRRHYSATSAEISDWLSSVGRKYAVEELNYGRKFGWGIDNWVITESADETQ